MIKKWAESKRKVTRSLIHDLFIHGKVIIWSEWRDAFILIVITRFNISCRISSHVYDFITTILFTSRVNLRFFDYQNWPNPREFHIFYGCVSLLWYSKAIQFLRKKIKSHFLTEWVGNGRKTIDVTNLIACVIPTIIWATQRRRKLVT